MRILHLEDDIDYSDLVYAVLTAEGLDVEILLVTQKDEFETALEREPFDLILADFQLPDMTGLQALVSAREKCPEIPFLLVSGTIAEQTAIESLKAGATDYVLKQCPERLIPAIRRAISEACERNERKKAESELAVREEYFKALTENLLDLVLILDIHGHVIYNSPSVTPLLGYSPEAITGKDAFDYIHPDDVLTAKQEFELTLSEMDRLTKLEFRARHLDGSWRFLEAMAQNRLTDPKIAGIVVSARDVTDRKSAEASLRESEKQYRLIFDDNPTPMWVFDHETLRFLEANDAALQCYGYTREEFLQLKLSDIRIAEDTPALVEYLHHLVEGTQPSHFAVGGVWQHSRKDGILLDVEVRWSPITFRGRSASLAMVNDVTDRKRAEHRASALAVLGQKLSSATTRTEAARIIRDVADELFRWHAFTLCLYTAEEDRIYSLLNIDTRVDGERFEIPIEELPKIPSARAKEVIEQGAKLILRESLDQADEDFHRIGEKDRPSASLMLVPIRNSTRVIGLLSIQSYSLNAYSQADLSILQTLADHCGGALERIHAERALKHSEMLFHSVWENSLDGMRLTDAEGIVVAVNTAFCRMVSLTRQELEGQLFTIVFASSGGRLEESLLKYREDFRQRVLQPPLERKLTLHNGAAITVEDRSSFVELPGQTSLLLTVLRDVTAQKRLEDQFRQAQKMEAIGQLAGGVAHDFNNILTVIHGHASLLQSGAPLPIASQRSAEQILQAAERAAGLTRQLLTFSRRQVMQTRRLDLNEVVGNMTKMLGRILGEDIALQLNYSPYQACLEADSGMVEQILLNLAVNSRDAMPQGGVLSIRISQREITEHDLHIDPEAFVGSFICLSVTDSGCGIAKQNIRRIFEPFFTTKEVGKGTGLGLATVYGIVKQHQGWILVQSEVGRGTTFHVFLPRAAEMKVAPAEPAAQPMVRGGTETILVVEDEGPVRELVCHLLNRHGYRTLEAESAPKAIEVWTSRSGEIDLLLTDLIMPDRMNGRELAERLWTDRPDLKVLFTSGYSADVVGRDFTARAGLQYLQKPYHPAKLAETVRDCLDAK